MLPGTNYFKSIDCPFFASGLCERPYCHFLHRRISFNSEPEPALPFVSQPAPHVDAKGHRFYPQPHDAPVYKPTPKALLATENKPKPYIPSSLAKVAALQKPPSLPRPTLKPREVLGDIGDLSSSDEESKNPDLIGAILLQGVKSGVLGGEVSEFQHELIKNTYKIKKSKPLKEELEGSIKKEKDAEVVIVISDDEDAIKEAQRKKAVEEEDRKKRILEDERLEAKRLLEEKEKELEELEKKRQILENFYGKNDSKKRDPSLENESRYDRKKNKHKSRKRKRSKKKYSRKKSKRRRTSSTSSSSSSSFSDSSSQSSSSFSSSEESDLEREYRRLHRKRSKHKKSKKHYRDKKISRKREELVKLKPDHKNLEMTIKKEGLDDTNKLNKISSSVIKKEKGLDPSIIIKNEPAEEVNKPLLEPPNKEIIPSPSQIKDEDLPESVKSFLDAMEEIDQKIVKDEKSKRSPTCSSEHKDHKSSRSHGSRKHSHSSSTHKSSNSGKSSKKSSHHDRRSSKSDEKSSHYDRRSSKSDEKSSHYDRRSSKSDEKKQSKSSSAPSSSSSRSSKSKSTPHEIKTSAVLQESIEEPTPGPSSKSDFSRIEENSSDRDEPRQDYFENSGSEDVFENEDDELKRIFEEHEEQVRKSASSSSNKKIKSAKDTAHSQNKNVETLNPKSKKRVAHKAETDSSLSRPPIVRKPISATQQMLERYKKIQNMRENSEIENRLASLVGEDEPPKSKMKSSTAQSKSVNKSRTVVTTTKGTARVSHVPTVNISKPLIAPDMKSKIPSSIRQRYLDSIVEECCKIYNGDKGNAYARATREEQVCCGRSKNRNIYLNVVVNCIKKLRTEASQAPKSKQTLVIPQGSMVTSHLQILAGKGGSKGSWSIEKPKSTIDENSPGLTYAILKRYVLSKEDMIENGYPVMNSEIKGKAYITQNPQYSNRKPQPQEPDKRRCDRCSTIYKVDLQGKQTETGECIYHWGRLYRQRSNRALGPTSGYYCCNGDTNSEGCEVSQVHITDMEDYNNMRGFVTAFSASEEMNDGNYGIYALDCEMCYTTFCNELTRVTVINYEGKTVYETMVKPSRDVIDYNTRFSGITQKDLENVTTTIIDVQAVLLSMFSSDTILIGHSLESDLKALKMVHSMVVDTSIVFPHKMGPPYKRALKHLAAEHLKRIIQNDVGGHDSAEDALAALDLMKVKVKSDVKKLQQDSLKQR
nr:RNA exonuclease 1 homolog isoform X2 [Lepeophtheirus salmonis]